MHTIQTYPKGTTITVTRPPTNHGNHAEQFVGKTYPTDRLETVASEGKGDKLYVVDRAAHPDIEQRCSEMDLSRTDKTDPMKGLFFPADCCALNLPS